MRFGPASNPERACQEISSGGLCPPVYMRDVGYVTVSVVIAAPNVMVNPHRARHRAVLCRAVTYCVEVHYSK